MRSRLACIVLVACGSTTPAPQRTAAAPPPPVPACTGDECSAPIQAEPRFEPPGETTRPPEVAGTPPEEATCATVGAALAAIELGNYADPAAVAPLIATHTARCEQAALDQASRTCLVQQSDRVSMAYCAQALFPEQPVPILATAQCETVVGAASKRLAPRSRIDYERSWWDARRAGYLASCRADRWTTAFGECVAASHPSNCTYAAVQPLRVAIQAMLVREDARAREERALWNRAYAEPKKHPKVKLELLSARACATVLAATTQRIAKLQAGHWEATWWAPRAAAFRTSCLRDRWPRDYGDCVVERGAPNCHAYVPDALQPKLAAIFALPQPPPRPVVPPRRPPTKRVR